MWNIEKIISKGDYNYCVVKDHPFATNNGYVLHHRIVIENHLGRLLNADEVVHHINGDKKDNRIANLEVMSISEHARLHAKTGRLFVKIKCPNCGKVFDTEKSNTHLDKGNQATFCSRSCNGSFYRAKQLSGETIQMKKAITENVLAIYKKYS